MLNTQSMLESPVGWHGPERCDTSVFRDREESGPHVGVHLGTMGSSCGDDGGWYRQGIGLACTVLRYA